jgi:hypothetical protein
VIAILPHIKVLDAYGTDEYEHAHWLEHLVKEKSLLEIWSSVSSTLSYVKFPTGAEWSRREGYWTHVHAKPNLYLVESEAAVGR